MKKYFPLTLLFSGVAFLSISLGLFKATNEMSAAKADGYNVEMEGDLISFGSYPQGLVPQSLDQSIENNGTVVDSGSNIIKYQYEGNYYTRVDHCISYTGAAVFETGEYGSGIFETARYFIWRPITWKKVKKTAEYTIFYSQYIIDTLDWQNNISGEYINGTTIYANDWENSQIRAFLNNSFYGAAFTDEEKNVTVSFDLAANENTSNKQITDRVGLLTKNELSQHTNLLNATGTNYALAKSLQYALDGTMSKAYYYLNSNENDPNSHVVVDCASGTSVDLSKEVNITKPQTECGVRPFIAIDNNHLAGKETIKTPTGGFKVNVALIVAIIFSVLGMAGVIAFLMMWHKGVMIKIGRTSGPIWMIASICLCVVITFVGVGMIFGSTVGTLKKGYKETDVIGYYSSPEFVLDTSDPEFGYSYYLGLSKDHHVYRYYADRWGGESINHYDLVPYNGVGSWELKGDRLIIHASSYWKLFIWETETTSYYGTTRLGLGKGGYLSNDGSQERLSHVAPGYRLYHGSTVDPTGEVVNIDTLNWEK